MATRFYIGGFSSQSNGFDHSASSFDEAIQIARDELLRDYIIAIGDQDGPHEVIAYRHAETDQVGSGPDRKHRLRIKVPEHVPVHWQPGGAGDGRLLPVEDYSLEDRAIPMSMTSHSRHTYPQVIQSLPGFSDSSWGNDLTDSVTFSVGGRMYKMFVQPPEIYEREDDSYPRYSVNEMDEEGDLGSDSAIDTESSRELLAWIDQERGLEDPTRTRARMLELDRGPRRHRASDRGSDPGAARARMLELDLDDLKFNPRRARRNPGDLRSTAAQAAKEKFEEFHRKKPTKIFERAKSPIPSKVRKLGKAVFVLYRSSKNDPDTGRPVPKPIDYIHEHDAGVHCYAPARGSAATIEVPSFIRDAEALVLLGKCLGFAFKDDGEQRDAEAIKPYPELYATPCGKALLVIQDKTEVLAIVWGGALGVESRGIVG